MKKSIKYSESNDITMTIKQEKLTNKILKLQEEVDYLRQINEADRYMLNFAKWQVDAYEKMLWINEANLDCNQDYCNG